MKPTEKARKRGRSLCREYELIRSLDKTNGNLKLIDADSREGTCDVPRIGNIRRKQVCGEVSQFYQRSSVSVRSFFFLEKRFFYSMMVSWK